MTEKNRSYDTVIFDLDGTLLDTLSDLTNSANAVTARYGFLQRTREEIRSFVGNGIRRLIARLLPDGEENPHFDAVYRDFLAYYGEHCMEETAPYPGIGELLHRLKEGGYAVGIVSNKADFAVKKLRDVYFGADIPVAIGDREGIQKKPAPDSVFEALEELGAQRSRTVYVGDSDVDILTAANAGIDCIAVSWGFRDRGFLLAHGAQPERIAADTQQLWNILEGQ
ncbi:HAD family hydrolase [Parablautia sp. Marseille-Q6255]|uniref:HAD family hydrolase n=1 Tax=Parablautia sp. Marseille-Q6255 TaxID=3039593 RepID=UPI0024BBF1DE|nr:HAD-IA family hydrolase [Parablautia sp. Marseille-Q6255]